MKNKQIEKLSVDELKSKINSLKKDLFNFRFRKVNGQLEDTSKVSQLKKGCEYFLFTKTITVLLFLSLITLPFNIFLLILVFFV